MRVAFVIAVLLAGCIEEFEAPEPAQCELLAPEGVALGEPFEVEVQCAEEIPAWFDFDFGDGAAFVRTSSAIRSHVYGDDMADHLWFRVQVYYVDSAGELQQIEAVIDRY